MKAHRFPEYFENAAPPNARWPNPFDARRGPMDIMGGGSPFFEPLPQADEALTPLNP